MIYHFFAVSNELLKKTGKFTFLVILWSGFGCAFGQVDELAFESGQQPSDSLMLQKIETGVGRWMSYHNRIAYIQAALTRSREYNLPLSEAKAEYLLGSTYWSHAQYDDALYYLGEALSHYRERGLIKPQAECFNTLGLTYFYISNYQKAIPYLDSALNLFMVREDSSNIARVLNNLGLVHQKIGAYEKSTNYLVDGIRYKVKYASLVDQSNATIHNSELHTNAYIVGQLIPELFSKMIQAEKERDFDQYVNHITDLGTLYQLIDQHDSAFYYLNKSATIYDSLGQTSRFVMDMLDIGDSYTALGNLEEAQNIYESLIPPLVSERMLAVLGNVLEKLAKNDQSQNQFKSAIYWYRKAIMLNDSVGHRASVAKMQLGAAASFLSLEDYFEAQYYAKETYKIAQEISSFTLKMESCRLLADIHEQLQNFEEALAFRTTYLEMAMIQKNANALRVSKELEARYELRSKAEEINDLDEQVRIKDTLVSQQAKYIGLLSFAALCFVALSIVIFKRNRDVRKLNAQILRRNEENETLLREVHHRVKNNLQMISSLINMQQRRSKGGEQAEMLSETKNRVKSIGMLHEHLYSFQEYAKTAVKPYVENLVGMLLGANTLDKEVQLKLEIDEFELDAEELLVIGLIINELVTNALKYAFKQEEKPTILIVLGVDGANVTLVVEDNGIGISDFQSGLGWTIINAMVDNLKGESQVKSDKGTRASIIFEDLLKKQTGVL